MSVLTTAGVGTLDAASSATIGPTSLNGQWIIHNIYVENNKQVTIEYGDGTTWVPIETVVGSLINHYFHVTYTYKLRLTNNEASSIKYGYDGVVIT